jgi:hypothetical protein
MAKPLFTHVVERARAHVAIRSHWTRYALALTRNNRDCDPTDARAARFCAFGALIRASFEITGDADQARRLAARTAMWITGRDSAEEAYEAIYTINDGPSVSSRRAVLELFEASLARA